MVSDLEILKKAKKTIYRNNSSGWYLNNTTKTVYDVMSEFAKTKDFYLDILPKYKYQYQLQEIGYNGIMERKSVTKWFIDNKHFDKLILRYSGSEGGSDKGILKIRTFIILKYGVNNG